MTYEYCPKCNGDRYVCRVCNRGRPRYKYGRHRIGCPGYKRDAIPCPGHLETLVRCNGCQTTIPSLENRESWSMIGGEHWCPNCTQLRNVAMDAAAELIGGGTDSVLVLKERQRKWRAAQVELYQDIRRILLQSSGETPEIEAALDRIYDRLGLGESQKT